MHQRAEIKAAIAAALAGRTSAADRIYPARYMPVPDSALPAICVYTPEENVADDSELTYRRVAQVKVECLVEDFEDESDADALAVQVERALAADDKLGGLVRRLRLRRVQTGVDENANRDFIATILTYEAEYYTYSYYNGTFDDLEGVDADYDDGVTSDQIDL